LLEENGMSRTTVIGLVAVLALGGCASTSGTRFSHTPPTEVVVLGAKKPARANFRVSPEESLRTGAGGGGSEK
jgi:hypothetical protein